MGDATTGERRYEKKCVEPFNDDISLKLSLNMAVSIYY